ncbi:MAG TPA: DUF523 domain-containing protein [Syntrophales bacterium]|nr:DUF523 domain-containing protein [Syntrophales bacterium]
MTARKPRVGVSSCLLGKRVRYDGGYRHNPYITDVLGKFFTWVPVCPEVEYGLGIPREPMRLVGNPARPRIVTVSGQDHTEGMMKWAEDRLIALEKENLSGFIFKSRSPSSAIRGVKVFSTDGLECGEGPGIFGGAFIKCFPLIPVIDDEDLGDNILRSNFLKSVFSYEKAKAPRKHG